MYSFSICFRKLENAIKKILNLGGQGAQKKIAEENLD